MSSLRTYRSSLLYFKWLLTTVVVACGSSATMAVDYTKDIAPLWKRSCVACHNSKKAEGGLNLESAALLLKGSDSGQSVISGKSAESELLKRIVATDDSAMPPKDNSAGAKPLTPAEVELVKQWIDAGAMPGDDGMPVNIVWQPVPGAFQPIYAVDTSIDSQFVASGRGNQVVVHSWPLLNSASTAIALVDPQTVQATGVPSAHLDLVQSVAFNPDCTMLASGGFRCVKLWKRDFAPASLVGLKPTTGVAEPSHQGNLLAVAREDKSVDIIDLSTRQIKSKLKAAEGNVQSIAWSLNDAALAVADSTNKVTVWQLPPAGAPADATAKSAQFSVPASVIAMAVVATDRAAVLLADNTVQLWSIEAAPGEPGKEPTSAFVKKDFSEPLTGIVALSIINGEPPKFVVASGDGTMRAVSALEGKILNSWKNPLAVTRLAAHPTQPRVAALGSDGSIRVWSVADGKEVLNTVPETAQARLVAAGQRAVARFSAEVDRLAATIKELETAHTKEQEAMKKVSEERDKAAAALATKVTEYDANANGIKEAEKGIEAAKAMIAEQMKRIEQLTADIEAKKKKDPELVAARDKAKDAVQKQDQTLAAAKEAVDRAAKAIPAQQAVVDNSKKQLETLKAEQEKVAAEAKTVREEAPIAFNFDPSGSQLVLGRKQGVIVLIDAAAGKVAMEVKASPNLVSAFSANKLLMAANAGAPISTWSSDPTWKLDRVIGSETDAASPLSDRITALTFSPDGQTLAVGSGPASRFGDVKLVRVSDGSITKDLGEVHSDTVLDMAFSPDGKQLASCGADKLVRVFDVSTGKQRLSLEGHTHHVLSVAWQDGGRILASASADGTIKLWDTISGEQQRTVSGFGKEITSLAYVGQTTQLLAACADNSLRLVEGNNGQTVRNFGGSSSALYSICVSPDNKQVIAGGQDGKLIIWAIENASVVKQLD